MHGRMDSRARGPITVRRAFTVLVVGMLVAGAVAVLRLPVDGAPPARAQAVRTPALRLGLQMHPFWDGVTSYDWNDELRIARHAQASVVRIDLAWSSLQLGGRG